MTVLVPIWGGVEMRRMMATGDRAIGLQQVQPGEYSNNMATRYLCGAPFLRYPMLPRKLRRAARRGDRELLPVGRAYAKKVLGESEIITPAPGVDVGQLIHHSYLGWRQSLIRDTSVGVVAIVCAVEAPFGTVVWLLTAASAASLPFVWRRWRRRNRRRLAAAVVLFLAIGGIVEAIVHRGGESRSLAFPLIAFTGWLLIFLADAIASQYRIRRLPSTLSRTPRN